MALIKMKPIPNPSRPPIEAAIQGIGFRPALIRDPPRKKMGGRMIARVR